MNLPVIIVGAGGHASVLIDALRSRDVPILGLVDADSGKVRPRDHGVPVLGGDDAILLHSNDSICLVNGIGSVRLPELRKKVFNRFILQGYSFFVVVHSTAYIARDAVLEQGAQIMAGAVVQPGCRIGRNTIVNTSTTLDHDCYIGDHVHLAPGVTLSGGVRVGDGTHIGTGATIIQGVSVGEGVLIGAGSVVVRDIESGVRAFGVPARVVRG